MGLSLNTDLETVHFHQNPAFAGAINQVAGYDAITASTTTQALDVSTFQTKVTASAVSSVATLPAGTFAGQRKNVTMPARSGSVTFILTPAAGVTWKQADGSTACASVTFDAAGEYLLVEWDGAKWVNQSTNATVA